MRSTLARNNTGLNNVKPSQCHGWFPKAIKIEQIKYTNRHCEMSPVLTLWFIFTDKEIVKRPGESRRVIVQVGDINVNHGRRFQPSSIPR